MGTRGKGKIGYILQAMNIIPLVTFGVLILLLGTHWFTKSMYSEVEQDLYNVSCSIVTALDTLYPGDYELVGDIAYQLHKGDHDITGDYTLIDRIKKDTGLEITLFYQDTRILTTIFDNNGQRIVGSGAPDVVVRDVLYDGKSQFYNNTIIYGVSYFSYYTPLYNQDGSIIGILFVGKPSAHVEEAVQASIYPLINTDIILILIVSLFTFLYTKKFASSLLQIHGFLKEVSTGDLNTKLDTKILKRSDELGEIALSALNMQRSLRTLVDRDALTSLSNRRFGDIRLRKIIEESTAQGTPFCVAIGDIDFFKNVNDNYGHECGDQVLKDTAALLKQHMHGKGFVARWGGEEFLLVFERTDLDEAYLSLTKLLDGIRAMEVTYNEHNISITMTFGVTPGISTDIKELLRNADEKLYAGKASGRNVVVK